MNINFNNNFLKYSTFLTMFLSPLTSTAQLMEVDNVVKDPTEVPEPINRKNNKHLSFDLHVLEVLTDIDGSGNKAWVWTFNGTVPGPMIRVMEGDTVTVNVINDAENVEPHSVDLHAVVGPGGGAVVTESLPGETKSVTFKATRQGTYIYHCAAEGKAWEHVGYGMFGLIVVEPKGGLPLVDKEFYIGQFEWYHNNLPGTEDVSHGLPSNTLMLDEAQASTEQPNFYSFNGHKTALFDDNKKGNAMNVNQGDKVRFFFVNGGPNKGSNWHIIGTIFDKVYQGHFDDYLRNQETEYVPPASAAMFELTAEVPGDYLLVDHAIFRVPNGALGLLHVKDGPWPYDIFDPKPE